MKPQQAWVTRQTKHSNVCVEYLDDEGQLCKSGIMLLSEDKIHDHQQFEAFWLKAFNIFKKHIQNTIKNWKRISNGCGAQFWSKFVIANLFKMRKSVGLVNISYN